jgi:hypothetical protein
MALVLAMAAQTAQADIALPPKTGAPLAIGRDASQETSRLIIPRKLLPAAAAPAADVGYRSVGAGIMLTAVIVGGGLAVAFTRRRKAGAAKLLSIALVMSLVLIGTALADIPLPSGRSSGNRPPRTQATRPGVVVEITDSGDQVTLILGKDAPKLP